jgi:hypothetical protein
MKPVLREAVRREYDRGIVNCSVEAAPSVAAPTELILDLTPMIAARRRESPFCVR